MRTGILGGTFDPPHIAHLLAGEAAYRQLGLDRVLFIPAGAPWQKAGRVVSDAGHRWAMTERAVKGVPYFNADDREVDRDGWTYTADTLATFPGDEELVLILGADAAVNIRTWERSETVLERARLAVAPRPGTAFERRNGLAGVTLLDIPALDVSGTMIRERAAAGRPIRFLVPERVFEYLGENELYRR